MDGYFIMTNNILHKIRDFADSAHGGQMRKYTPERYIVHPIRVMELCRPYTSKNSVLAAALLHDVLEDTPTTAEELLNSLTDLMGRASAEETVKLVVELTDEYEKKNYPQWNRKKRKEMEAERMAKISAEAQTIKYADIIDNAREIMKYDRRFGMKFLFECRQLLQNMRRGDPALRKQALEMVDDRLQ